MIFISETLMQTPFTRFLSLQIPVQSSQRDKLIEQDMDEMTKKYREPKYYHLKKTECQALIELKNNWEITIRAADEGRGIVIMNKNLKIIEP